MARSRLAVLGLDGLPLPLARALSPELPNLARITERATTVDAELPELSPVNWTSFFTGQGPETHGVFGFARMDPQTYEVTPVNSTHVACPTVFDRLSERGLSSRVINLPNTAPAKPLNGMLVAGFVAPDLQSAVYPPFLAGPLSGYKLEADTTRGSDDPAYLFQELRATLAARRKALDLFWPDLDWDLFVFVLTETDRLFHFFHPACEDRAHLLHADCMALLREWDGLMGEFLARYDALDEPKRLVVLADHGFTTLRTEVNLNAWLVEHGLLTLAPAADEWDARAVTPASRAFALDPGRICLHRASRFAHGPLSDAEADALIPAIREGLESLTFDGERVMERVMPAQELYPGMTEQVAAAAPDLVCVPKPGFDCKAKFDGRDLFGRFGRFGAHTVRDAIFFDSHGETPRRMRDVGNILLKHFGIGHAH